MDTADQIRVEILATAAQFRAELDTAIKKLAGPGGLKDAIKDIPAQVTTELDVDDAKARLTLENFKGRIATLKEEVKANWKVGDIAGVNEAVAEIKRIEDAAKDAKDAVRDISPSLLQRLGDAGGAIGGGAGRVFTPSLGPVPLAAMPLAAPVGLGLAGGAASLAGSAGAGILGAGALGVGGIGALITGLGSVMAVAKPAMAAIGEVTKAQDALTKAQERYGAGSKQAAQAQQNLNVVLKEAGPGAAAASAGLQALGDAWKTLSAPAQTVFFQIFSEWLKTLQSLLPTVAAIAKSSLEAINAGLQPVFAGLQSAGFRTALTELGHAFAQLAPPLIQGFANIFHSLMLVAIAAAPYVVEIAREFLKLTQGWLASAANGAKLRELIGDLVSQTRSWVDLAIAIGKLLVTIFSAGASQGQGMVNALTQIVGKWTAWLNTSAGQEALKRFFADSRALVEALLTMLGRLGPVLGLFFQATSGLMPIVTQAFRVLADAIKAVIGVITKVAEAFGGAKVAGDLLGGTLVVLAAAWAVGKIQAFIGALQLVAGTLRALFALIATSPIGALLIGVGLVAVALSGAFSEGQHKAKTSADQLNEALSRQAENMRTLRDLAHEGAQSKLRVEEAFTQVKVAKSTLAEDEKRHASSLQIRQDIEAVKQAELDASQAVKDNRNQEQKSYEAKRDHQGIDEAAIRTARSRISTIKEEIKAEYDKLLQSGKSEASDEHLQHLKAQLKTAEEALAKATKTANETVAGTTEDASHRVDKAVTGSIGDINKQLLAELRLLNPGGIATLAQGGPPLAPGLEKALEGKAGGGYIGHPSERGHDEVPIVVGRGEAVLHAGHQAVVNQALAATGWQGGLAEVFAKTGGLHYNMAAGGFAGGGWTNAVASAESLGGTGYQGNPIVPRGYSELSVPPSVANAGSALGHLPYLTRMRIRAGQREVVAAKQDIGAGSSFNPVMGLYPGTVADLGLSGGEFHVAIERADGQPLTGGAVASSATAAVRITTPKWKGPGGLLGAVGKGAVAQVVKGANQRISSLAPTVAPGGGGAGASGNPPTGGGFDPGQLGTFDGWRVAKWIIPELEYARAHGWSGHITSGYRPGFDPSAPGGSMHALDIYPGGAVDFGGPAEGANAEAFRRATAGYTGKRLLAPIGFVDLGHMSGTGHAAGGFVGGFQPGGFVASSKRSRPPKKKGGPIKVTPRTQPHGQRSKPPPLSPLLPGDINRALQGIHADELRLETLGVEYKHLLDAQALVPTQALVTLTEADVTALDPGKGPGGRNVDATGQVIDSPRLHYQPGDEIVNAHGMSFGRFFGPSGVAGGHFIAGIDTRQHQIADLEKLLGAEEGAAGHEEGADKALRPREEKAVKQKLEREKRMRAFLARNVARALRVKAHIEALRSGNLQANLKAAISKGAISARKAELSGHLAALRTELAHETKHQGELIPIEKDPGFADSLRAQIGSVTAAEREEARLAAVAGSSTAINKARGAILKDNLSKQLRELTGENKALGGLGEAIGEGGAIAHLHKQIVAVKKEWDTRGEHLRTIPPIRYEFAQQLGALKRETEALNAASPVQVRVPAIAGAAASSQKDAELLALVKQQLAQTQQALAISQAQFQVFAGFAPLLQGRLVGSFAQGVDRVARSGPAMVHAGEVILPDPSGPYGNAAVAQARGGGPPVEITLVMANNDKALMKLLDARMNDRALRVVSDKSGQRSRLIAGVTTLAR